MSRLASILEAKKREVVALGARRRSVTDRRPHDVVAALARGGTGPMRLVAEIKFRSPSAGPLSRSLSVSERALAYARGGAAMISVLCDAAFFDGSWDHLQDARASLDAQNARIPILAKEFVVDESQIREARFRGADAVLVIARILPPARLVELVAFARAQGIEPFVEVVDEGELEVALAAEARVVGVNARDLDTLAMDAARARRVLERVPSGVVAVHLSGVRDAADVAEHARGRADAALIGESLMRDADPEPRLRAMVQAAGGAARAGHS